MQQTDLDSRLASLPPQFRTSQLAKTLDVATATVRAMVARGRLPAPLKLSPRVWLYDREAVREAIRRLAEGGAQ